MPYVLEFSKPNCTRRLAELARISDIGESGAPDAELADAFIARIRKLNADMQIPSFVKQLRREDFDKIIDRAFAEAHGTYGVPRYMTRAEALLLLEKLLP
jgi:alcohol dehydrogenase class IV